MVTRTSIKTPDDIRRLREGGRRLGAILKHIASVVAPGITTRELDTLAEKLIRAAGDDPAFLNYQPYDADFPYPATLCVSVNDEVVHGIPGDKTLAEGDIVSLDLGLIHEERIVDAAVTVAVGAINAESKKLIAATRDALIAGIAAARGGNTVGDIGAAIEGCVKKDRFSIVDILGGHGVGYAVHEEPFVPNYGTPGKGVKLMPGMVLALEPIVSTGDGEVFISGDGYTYLTADNARAAHFEHTILITDGAPEILTV